jgi:hypothetical protein
MKKLFSIFFIAVVPMVLLISVVQAQECSDSDRETINTNIAQAVDSVEQALPACEILESVLTIKKVEELAETECCGKSKIKQRRKCLKRARRKYLTKNRRGDQRIFFKAAIKAILAIRKSDCGNKPYNQLF